MPWLDVTVPIRPAMPLYPGDPPVLLRRVADLARGDLCTLSAVDFGLHTGTHVDAPAHFIPGGPGIESIRPEVLVGPAWVVEATQIGTALIDAAALAALDIPAGVRRVLFRTRSSALWANDAFSPDYVALAPDAARALVARGVALVGVDAPSVAALDDPAPVHRILLAAGVVVLEGLDLRSVPPGPCELIALPLLVPGADGAPARVLLRPIDPAGAATGP